MYSRKSHVRTSEPIHPLSKRGRATEPHFLEAGDGVSEDDSLFQIECVLANLGGGSAGIVYMVKVQEREGFLAMKVFVDRELWINELQLVRKLCSSGSRETGHFTNYVGLAAPSVQMQNMGVRNESGCSPLLFGLILSFNPAPYRFQAFSSVSFLLKYWQSLFEALSVIHENNWAHGDVKPSNYLMDEQRNCFVLIDFSHSVDLTSGRLPIGTRGYRPCEMLDGSTADPVKIDIWAAGATVLDFVSRRRNLFWTKNSEVEGAMLKSDSFHIGHVLSESCLADSVCANQATKLLTRVLNLNYAARPTAAEVVLEVGEWIRMLNN